MSIANALEQQMLELINQERTNAGLSALVFSDNLNDSSEDHSLWMLDRNVFSHTGINGTSSHDRMIAASFPFEGNYSSGENIAWQSERGAPGLEDDVVDLHNSLMQSPGHRANILNPNFETIGIGIEGGDFSTGSNTYDSVMVTQNFASTDADFNVGTPDPVVPAPTPDPVPDPVDTVDLEPEVDPVDPVVTDPDTNPDPVDAADPDATPNEDPAETPDPVDTVEMEPEKDPVDADAPDDTADPDMACGPVEDEKDPETVPELVAAPDMAPDQNDAPDTVDAQDADDDPEPQQTDEAQDDPAADIFDNAEFLADLNALLDRWDVELPMLQDCFDFGNKDTAEKAYDVDASKGDFWGGKIDAGGWKNWSDANVDTDLASVENEYGGCEWIMPASEMMLESTCSYDI
ncbi:MAG: CAP domain-containing protein [Sulfitobacter sp.]